MKKLKVKKLDEVEKSGGAFRLKPGPKAARGKHKDDLAVLAKGGLKVEDLVAILVRVLQRVEVLEEE
ncbi:MAG: hypothetical protein WCG34_10040 [Leptolinea sp.]